VQPSKNEVAPGKGRTAGSRPARSLKRRNSGIITATAPKRSTRAYANGKGKKYALKGSIDAPQ